MEHNRNTIASINQIRRLFLTFSSVAKKWPLSRGYFGSWAHALVESWPLHMTISKYHSWYLCQISLQIMLLPILIVTLLL